VLTTQEADRAVAAMRHVLARTSPAGVIAD